MLVNRQMLLALGYFVTGWLGLQIPYVGTQITLIWLPTGIALAALLRWDRHVWPGIYLGAILVNLSTGAHWWVAAAIAVGNTLGPYLAGYWLERVRFHAALDRQKDVGNLAVAACAGMTVPAFWGVTVLFLAGLLPTHSLGFAWLSWWMGDAVGVFLAAPLLLTLTRQKLAELARNSRELLLWVLIAGPVSWLAFFDVHGLQDHTLTLTLAFLTLPLFTWAALRLGSTGAALAGLLFALVASWGTATGRGTFSGTDSHISLFLLWSYIVTLAVTGLLITSLQAERLRVEATLRESEEKLRGLYELSPLGIALTDMQGRYIEFNAAFSRISGYTMEELQVLDYWALTPKKYAAEEARQLESLQRDGHYGPYEKEYIRKDGRAVPLRLNGMLITRSDGNRYIWSIVEDITDWRQAEKALYTQIEKNQALLRNASDGIHILDMSGTVIEVSDSFCRMLGYSRDDMLGMNVQQWDAKFPSGDLTSIIKMQYQQGHTQFETRHRRQDGIIFDVEISGMPLVLDGQPVMFYSSRDITERKAAEESIKNLAFYDPLT
ncbi:MAG TPA: PAS domain S-box protein, partial [Gammaproteobacteria bacterium]